MSKEHVVQGDIAVECKGVIKDFGSGSVKQRVLHGIDWQIPIGATTFLVGPSGCGKTTLISIIAGLLTPTEGSVRILDQEITEMRRSRVVKFRAHRLGFIFQQFNLLPSLRAVENAAVSLVVQGSTLAAAKRQASVLLDKLGMEQNKLNTGTVSERVDTRVIQVIYSVSPKSLRAIVGQQVDVYIEDNSAKN